MCQQTLEQILSDVAIRGTYPSHCSVKVILFSAHTPFGRTVNDVGAAVPVHIGARLVCCATKLEPKVVHPRVGATPSNVDVGVTTRDGDCAATLPAKPANW